MYVSAQDIAGISRLAGTGAKGAHAGARYKETDMHLKQIWDLISKSAIAWVDNYAPSMGAALAYYTLFSLAPLLIIAIAAAGLVFGQEAARGEIVAQIQGLIGREGAIAVQGLLKSANEPTQDIVATLVSIVTLAIGATTVFSELQSDLDRIWRVPAAASRICKTPRQYTSR